MVAASTSPASARGSTASATGAMWATSDVVVNGSDVTGVALALQPAMTLSGKLELASMTASRPANLNAIRLMCGTLPLLS